MSVSLDIPHAKEIWKAIRKDEKKQEQEQEKEDQILGDIYDRLVELIEETCNEMKENLDQSAKVTMDRSEFDDVHIEYFFSEFNSDLDAIKEDLKSMGYDFAFTISDRCNVHIKLSLLPE